MDEFDSYVKDAYEEAESLDVVTEEYVSEESSSLDVAPLASIAYYQKYFYNSGNTNNYLYVRAYVNSDTSKYTGEVYDIGSVQKSYPSYKCKSASYSFSSNKKTITCNYRVTKYLSSTLIETTTKNISCTFIANGAIYLHLAAFNYFKEKCGEHHEVPPHFSFLGNLFPF